MRAVLPALIIALAPLPANAQTAPQSAPPIAADAAAGDTDPARLAAAQQVVAKVFPEGTYARLMGGSFSGMLGKMSEGIADVPLRDLVAAGGMSEAERAKIGPGTVKEMMAILDPAFQKRMDLTMQTMLKGMVPIMSQFEPEIRDGLAHAYAKRFTPAQLADLSAFFATPTGADYGRDSMMLFMDPAVMGKMQAFVPALMKQMPQLMEAVKTATADLPPQKTWAELTPAERRKLAQLLGVPEAKLAPKTAKRRR